MRYHRHVRALALLAALTAGCDGCGDSAGSADARGDGASSDAVLDADPNVRGTVTIRIVDKNDAPLAGFYVVFVDTDGTLTETTTDAAGAAAASVYPNASVTAIRTRGAAYALTTVQALVPGDTITLISAASDVSSSEDPFSQRVVPLPSANIAPTPNGATKSGSIATFTTLEPHGLAAGDRVIVQGVAVAGYNGTWTVTTATATTFSANLGGGGLADSGTANIGATAAKGEPFTITFAGYAGAERYEVHTPCGTLDVGASTSPTIVLRAGCAASTIDLEVHAKTNAGALLAWTQSAGVTFVPSGSTVIADPWQAPSALMLSYTNTTSRVTDVDVERFSPYVRGVAVAAGSTAPASGTATLVLSTSKPARAAIRTTFHCPSGASPDCTSTSTGGARQFVTEVADGAAATYALDVGASLLPWLRVLYVPLATTLEIETFGTGTYDLVESNLRYTRGQTIYTWRTFSPLAQDLAYPTLPATAPGDPTIRPNDPQSGYQVFLCESDAIDGYRDAIENPYLALSACEASAAPGILPSPGAQNRVSQWN